MSPGAERYTGKTALLEATGRSFEDVEAGRAAANYSAEGSAGGGMKTSFGLTARDAPTRGGRCREFGRLWAWSAGVGETERAN